MKALRGRVALAGALSAVAVLAVSACGEKEEPSHLGPPPLAIDGQWHGTLQQKGRRPFSVQATIRSRTDPKRNTVHYTEIDCRGNWSYLGRRSGSYRFHEVIDRGEDRACKGEGTVTLTPVPMDHLRYEFTGGGIESQGTLSRI